MQTEKEKYQVLLSQFLQHGIALGKTFQYIMENPMYMMISIEDQATILQTIYGIKDLPEILQKPIL